ncbi:MAG: lysophospholipid acyltransferase family protein [Pseudomonadota bacterium]
MTSTSETISAGRSAWDFSRDLAVTLLLWGYFTLGFIMVFSPFYLAACLIPSRRELAFQGLNHMFYRGFFVLVQILIPGHRFRIAPEVRGLKSCVVVCNHVSYLDPLVMISLFRRHKTIVKSTFFKTPIFGWVIRASGYLPSVSQGGLSALMVRQMTGMEDYLSRGGVLFVFPEGTRNRKAGIAGLNPGAFKIARMCRVPIRVLAIRNTDKLFTPGRFLFNTRLENTIHVDLAGTIDPDYTRETVASKDLMDTARTMMETGGMEQ